MLVFLVLLAAIAPLVVAEPLNDQLALPKLATTAALTGGALVWGAVLLLRERWPAGKWPVTIWAPVVIFVLVNILALVFADHWRGSLLGERFRYQGLGTIILYVLLFGATAASVRTTRDLRWLLLGLYFGAFGAAVYALIQKAGWGWWPTPIPDRPGSTVGQANEFGALLVLAMSASMFLVLTEQVAWRRTALVAGLSVMLPAFLFSLSRSAFLAAGLAVLIFGAAAVAWFLPRLRAHEHARALRIAAVASAAVPFVLALVVVFFVGMPQGRVAITNEENDAPTDQRLTLWRIGLEMTQDRPLLGYGQDSFGTRFSEYRDAPDMPGIGTKSIRPESTHNAFIDLAAGTGILGLCAFLAVVVAVLGHAAHRAWNSDDPDLRIALVALATAATGYLAAIFFGFTESMTTWAFWLVLGATAGLLAQLPSPAGAGKESSPESGSLASSLSAVGMLVVGLVAIGWAGTLIAADLSAAQAEDAANRADFDAGVDLASRAVMLNPLKPDYMVIKATNYERSAGVVGVEEAYSQAAETYKTLMRRYGPDGYYTLFLAMAEANLAGARGLPVQIIFPRLEYALELEPYDRDLREFISDFYEARGFDAMGYRHRVIMACWTEDCDFSE